MTDDEQKTRVASDFVAGLIDGDMDRMRSALATDATGFPENLISDVAGLNAFFAAST